MNKLFLILLSLIVSFNLYSNDLCRTWKIKNYIYLDRKFGPSNKQDYMKFNCDKTMISVDSGIESKGLWEQKDKELWVYDANKKDGILLIIKHLDATRLNVIMKGEGKDIEIEYYSK